MLTIDLRLKGARDIELRQTALRTWWQGARDHVVVDQEGDFAVGELAEFKRQRRPDFDRIREHAFQLVADNDGDANDVEEAVAAGDDVHGCLPFQSAADGRQALGFEVDRIQFMLARHEGERTLIARSKQHHGHVLVLLHEVGEKLPDRARIFFLHIGLHARLVDVVPIAQEEVARVDLIDVLEDRFRCA